MVVTHRMLHGAQTWPEDVLFLSNQEKGNSRKHPRSQPSGQPAAAPPGRRCVFANATGVPPCDLSKDFAHTARATFFLGFPLTVAQH
jgi:hypothetical protein